MTSAQHVSQEPVSGTSEAQTFACTWPGCGRLFRAQFSLNRHMVLHTEAKRYTCNVCQRTFSLPQYLREHEYTHTKEMPYVCGVAGCTMRFRQAGKLSLHRRTHPEYKPKKYDYSLNKEKRTHTKTKTTLTKREGEFGETFRVTKVGGQTHSADANDETKAMPTHPNPAAENCPHQCPMNPGLKPLPALSSQPNSCFGGQKLEETRFGLHCAGKLLPMFGCVRADTLLDPRYILPQTMNAATAPGFSGLDLFALVKNYEA